MMSQIIFSLYSMEDLELVDPNPEARIPKVLLRSLLFHMIIHLVLGSNVLDMTVIKHNRRAYWYQECALPIVNLLNALNFNARDDNHCASCLTCQL